MPTTAWQSTCYSSFVDYQLFAGELKLFKGRSYNVRLKLTGRILRVIKFGISRLALIDTLPDIVKMALSSVKGYCCTIIGVKYTSLLEIAVSHCNVGVKFEFNDKYRCIRKTILSEDKPSQLI